MKKLRIVIEKAEYLTTLVGEMSLGNKSFDNRVFNPYCSVYVGNMKEERTQVIKMSNSPAWSKEIKIKGFKIKKKIKKN
jgi:hypothetical protein